MSFLLIVLIFFVVGIITVRGIGSLGNLTRTIYEHPLVVSNASLGAALNIARIHRDMKDVVFAESPDELDSVLRKVTEGEQKVYQQLDIIRKNILGGEGKEFERVTRELFTNWQPIREEVIQLVKSGNTKDAILITKGKGANHVFLLETRMLELANYARKKADTLIASNQTIQGNLEKNTFILIFLGVVLSIIIAFVVTKRILKTEKILKDKNNTLQKALDEIKTLRGIIPICMYCKKIKGDKNVWDKLEEYIEKHSDADFSHGICPDCLKIQLEEVKRIKE